MNAAALGKSYHGSSTVHLTCAETAKLLRHALKQEFPGVKFSVRSDTYSGGASIRVRWTDGPLKDPVQNVCDRFRGADFDGMIDLKSYRQHWLYPDGTVSIAVIDGTEGSRGYIPAAIGDPTGPTARLVRLGADFIFADRDESDTLVERATEIFEGIYGEPFEENRRYEVRWDDRFPALHVTGEEYGSTLRWRIVRTLS